MSYEADTTGTGRGTEDDPWNRWVFEVGSSENLGLEETEQKYEVEGLSVFSAFNVGLVQDQLYLPAGEASLDEVLLRRRERATSYELDARLGLSYTFGSIYNNVVNTRL